jgi:uncharacterized protein (DUF1810 family)
VLRALPSQNKFMEADPTGIGRFVKAQEGTYDAALAQIRRGAKTGHWMWYIFPQMKGLGHSATAQRFGIASLDEARAYLAHPLLGPRLHECVVAIADLAGTTAIEVFGEVDAMKLRSSLTLFSRAGGGPVFAAALEKWFGSPDPRTLQLLGGS